MALEFFRDAADEVRWRIRSDNHVDLTADSGEGYVHRNHAAAGLLSTLRTILRTTNDDLVGTPLEGFDLESLLRTQVREEVARWDR